MKQWKITITAQDEGKAIDYIDHLLKSFNVADKFNLPMDFCSFEDPETKESMFCNLTKK